MNESNEKAIKLSDLLINQILILSEWNQDNIRTCPEQVRLNCETISKLAETTAKIKKII